MSKEGDPGPAAQAGGEKGQDGAEEPAKAAAKPATKPATKPTTSETFAKAEAAAKAAEEAEHEVRVAQEKAKAARAEAEAAAEAEYKAIAAEVKEDSAREPDYTFKRKGEEIFRREMGEPEFWLEKEDRFPRPILTADQQESLTRKVEIPHDQTPKYDPQNVLSPEFGGMSNYERGVGEFLEGARKELARLQGDPDAAAADLRYARDRVTYLESLHENYHIGMNVFRTAKGGRDKLRA